MIPTILFVHFKLCRRWQAKAMHTIQSNFPHYAVDNIVRHFDFMVEAKQEKGDEMVYLFEAIGESNAICIHTPDPYTLMPFQGRVVSAATALSVPIWTIDNDHRIFMDFHVNPELITCLDIPSLKPLQA